MKDALQRWLQEAGFGSAADLAPIQANLGSTALWSFTGLPGHERMVVRVFPQRSGSAAQREAAAMRAAHHAGVPVPAVHAVADVQGHPLLVTAFVPGISVRDALLTTPERAHDLGVAMGETLGRIHRITAPDALAEDPRSWIDAGGPALAPIRHLLAGVPDQDRLAHLDYHPLNVLTNEGRISGVIDWENTRAAPPHMDLARSRAILQAAQIGGALPPGADALFESFAQGLEAGHVLMIGPDPHPALSTAWGLAMTTADLTAQAAKSGSPISQPTVDQLAAVRDAAIATARDATPPRPGSSSRCSTC